MAERLFVTLLTLIALVGLTFYYSKPVVEVEQRGRQVVVTELD